MSFLCSATRRLPLVLCIFTPTSIFLTYAVAVLKGHVSPFWPYISDTGTKPPESCIFGLLLSIVAFLLCVIIYVRYREVSEYAKLYPSVGISTFWNRSAAFLGFLAALGLHVVANFQELNEFTTHVVGAFTCFFSATLYFILQTIFTRKIQPEAKCLFWMRTTFTLSNVLFLISTMATVGPAIKEFKGTDILKWDTNSGGFVFHVISTVSEWLLVFSFTAYITTMFWDFRKFRIQLIEIKFVSLEEGSEIEDENNKSKTLWI